MLIIKLFVEVQLSVTDKAGIVIVFTHVPESIFTVISVGNGLITGATSSTIVITWLQVLVYSVPFIVCFAVQITVVVPFGNTAAFKVVFKGADA